MLWEKKCAECNLKLGVLVSVLTLVACQPIFNRPMEDFRDVYRQVSRSVFLIETPSGRGSGWLIDSRLLLTVDHLVSGHDEVVVRQAITEPFTATVLGHDSLRDIALLQVDEEVGTFHGIDGEPRLLKLGQISGKDIAIPLLVLGYSTDDVRDDGTVGRAQANVGILSQVAKGPWGNILVMDVPVDPGDSGGPVLNPDGLVVGLVIGTQKRAIGASFALDVSEIRAALPALKRGESR